MHSCNFAIFLPIIPTVNFCRTAMICSYTPSGTVQQPTHTEKIREISGRIMEYVVGTPLSLISGTEFSAHHSCRRKKVKVMDDGAKAQFYPMNVPNSVTQFCLELLL